MNDCLDCKHSYIEDIWNEVVCELKNHYCHQTEEYEYEGKVYDKNMQRYIKCKNFNKNS